MIKSLQFFLSLTIIVLSPSLLLAQRDRTDFDVKNQKIEITPALEIKSADNIPEKQTIVKFQQSNKETDSLLPANQTMANMFSTKSGTKQNYSVQRSKRNDETNDGQSAKIKKTEEPFFPDFKVEATQEQPYDNGFVLQENSTQKLVKLERVPVDDFKSPDINTTNQNKIIISPSKRKYLEGIVAELEKEIRTNTDSITINIQAKKKELEDYKKLLAQ